MIPVKGSFPSSPAPPVPTQRWFTGPVRRLTVGILVGWLIGALLGLLAIVCWPSLPSGLRTRVHQREKTIFIGLGGFSFFDDSWRAGEVCDISFERQQLGGTRGVIMVRPHACCGVMDFGDVALSSVREAPPSPLFDLRSCRPVELIKGHTYCVAAGWPNESSRSAGGKPFHYGKFTVVDVGQNQVSIRYVAASGDERTFPDASGQTLPHGQRPWELALMDSRTISNQLDWRLKCAVPAVRQLLMEQVSDINATTVIAPSEAVRLELDGELRELARLLVALEAHERECASMMDQMDAAERKLGLVGMTEEVLGRGHEELLREVQGLSQRVSAQLKNTQVQVGATSATEESATEDKLRQLKGSGSRAGPESGKE